jgi:predicted nucleic acid-binding protein
MCNGRDLQRVGSVSHSPIAVAVAAQADLIVSGDRKHLLPLGSHAGIAIVDVAEALRLIGSA